jgi:ABC-type sugar transport system permease subunit
VKGGAKSFVGAAALATLAFLALAHFEHRREVSKLQERRVEVMARALGFAQVQEGLREDDAAEGLAQRFAEALPKAVPGVEQAFVLKRNKYLAHSDGALAEGHLDSESLTDKVLFDRGRKLEAVVKNNAEERERNPSLGTKNAFPEVAVAWSATAVTVAVPIKEDGQYRSMAQVTARPVEVPARFPTPLPIIAGAVMLLFGLIATRLKGVALVGGGTAVLVGTILAQAWSYQAWQDEVRADHAQRLVTTLGHLGQAGLLKLAVEPEGAAALPLALAERPSGGPAGDLVMVESATVAATVPDAVRFDADGVAVYYARAFLAPGASTGRGLLLWSIGFALLAGSLFILGALGQLRRAAEAAHAHRGAYAYMAPAMAGMLVLVFVPVVYGISLSFQERQYGEFHFVGLKNFLAILVDGNFSHPNNFYFKLVVTVLWTVSNVTLHVVIGLFLALLLNDQFLKAKGVLRVLLIVPWAVPNYITALIWKGMFHKQFGAFNLALQAVGLEPVAWFNSFWPAFFTNLSTNTWLGFPFMMVVSLGALQSIPTDLYEAAIVDGASRWQRFRNITLPLLMPALVPAVMVGTVWTFNMFNVIYLVSGGAPNGATDILITEAFRWAFERDRWGMAAAYSTVIFLILAVNTTITNRITGATKGAFE